MHSISLCNLLLNIQLTFKFVLILAVLVIHSHWAFQFFLSLAIAINTTMTILKQFLPSQVWEFLQNIYLEGELLGHRAYLSSIHLYHLPCPVFRRDTAKKLSKWVPLTLLSPAICQNIYQIHPHYTAEYQSPWCQVVKKILVHIEIWGFSQSVP